MQTNSRAIQAYKEIKTFLDFRRKLKTLFIEIELGKDFYKTQKKNIYNYIEI